VIGFEGFRDYPALLREVQDVYAVRSVSLSSVAGGLGAPVWAAIAVATTTGLACITAAVWLVRGEDGDRRAFMVLVAGSIVASAIVWPNYLALLLVPVAMSWPRLAPAWFFGYVVWLASALAPKPTVSGDICCRPQDVTPTAWDSSHSEPEPWFAAGAMAVVILLTFFLVRRQRQQS
jgi:hypothetical protein